MDIKYIYIIPLLNFSQALYKKKWKINVDIYIKIGRYVRAKEGYSRSNTDPAVTDDHPKSQGSLLNSPDIYAPDVNSSR
jgi:hypothetical protein